MIQVSFSRCDSHEGCVWRKIVTRGLDKGSGHGRLDFKKDGREERELSRVL